MNFRSRHDSLSALCHFRRRSPESVVRNRFVVGAPSSQGGQTLLNVLAALLCNSPRTLLLSMWPSLNFLLVTLFPARLLPAKPSFLYFL